MGQLQDCEDKTREFCGDLLAKCWDRLDSRLYEVARQISNDTLRNRHYAVMQEVRFRADQVSDRLNIELERQFERFNNKKALRRKPTMRLRPDQSGADSTEALEDSLAITQIIGRVQASQQQALWQLNKRVSLLRGGKQCEDEDNPMGPSALLLAFQYAVRDVDVDVRIRLVIYDVFGEVFREFIAPFYDTLNQQLKAAGILPNLMVPGASTPMGTDRDVTPSQVDYGIKKPGNYSSNERKLDEMQALLLRTTQWPEAIEKALANASGLRRDEYVTACVQLQRHIAQNVNFDRDQLVDPLSTTQDYYTTLATLLKGGQLGANKDVLLSIELLARMFDNIRRNSALPFQLRCLLSYLFAPYIKLAITDRSFFLLPEHPARRLLDSMVYYGALWLGSQPDDRILIPKVREICKRLAYDLGEDNTLLEQSLLELQDHLDNTLLRTELAERRSIQAQEGMQALDEAQVEAERLFSRSCLKKQVNRHVMSQLRGPCTDFLAFVLLKHGHSSYWTSAVRLLDGIALSVRSRLPREQLVQFQRGQQRMLNVVRQSLFDAGYRGVLARDLVKSVRSAQIEALKLLAETDTTSTEQVNEELETPVHNLDTLRVGRWYQFSDIAGIQAAGAQSVNLKLAWISSRSDRYMFVDANGINRRLESADTLEASLAKALVLPAALPHKQHSESTLNGILHELHLASLRNKFTQGLGSKTTQKPSNTAAKTKISR